MELLFPDYWTKPQQSAVYANEYTPYHSSWNANAVFRNSNMHAWNKLAVQTRAVQLISIPL